MSIVVFDEAKFLDVYPTLAAQVTAGKLTPAQLAYFFQLAELILDNTDAAQVPYDPENGIETREVLFFLLVCHLATMALWPVGQSGPMTSGSEGSVSASFQLPQNMGPAWFNQTPCGGTFFQAMRKYIIGGRYYAQHYHHPWG